MPLIKTLTTLAVCDFCGATAAHVAGTGAPLAEEYFEAQHWTVLEGGAIACPRCSPILATVVEVIAAGVDRAEAMTR